METDNKSGKCFQSESYGGKEKMQVKKEQTYLGDLISDDENIQRMYKTGKIRGLE